MVSANLAAFGRDGRAWVVLHARRAGLFQIGVETARTPKTERYVGLVIGSGTLGDQVRDYSGVGEPELHPQPLLIYEPK